MMTPEDVQQIRAAADLIEKATFATAADQTRDVAEQIEAMIAELAEAGAKVDRADAATLQIAAQVIRTRFGAGSLEDAVRTLANEILEPHEGTVGEKPESKPEPAFKVTPKPESKPLTFDGLLDAAFLYYPRHVFPLGRVGIWPPAPSEGTFKIRREGYDAGVRAAVDLLRFRARTSKKARGFDRAADAIDAHLPGSTAKK